MIDAKGTIVDVTKEKEPDLLWAIRGTGQFFGLVTELVIKAHPLNDLGNDQEVLWVARFVFPLERAKEAGLAMKTIMDDGSKATAGMLMIMAPPPERKPAVVIAARYIGNPDDSQVAYKSLYDLEPLVVNGGPVPIQNSNDTLSLLEVKGGYKRYGVVGLRRFNEAGFLKTIDVWKKLITECPDAANTSFNFQWDSRYAKAPDFGSAMSLHDIRYWQYVLLPVSLMLLQILIAFRLGITSYSIQTKRVVQRLMISATSQLRSCADLIEQNMPISKMARVQAQLNFALGLWRS